MYTTNKLNIGISLKSKKKLVLYLMYILVFHKLCMMCYHYGFTYYIFAVVQNCFNFIFKQNIWNIIPIEQFKLYFN